MICTVEGCSKKVAARKLCSMHYWRLTVKGSTDPTPRSKPMIDRFWDKVDKRGDDECWEWKGQVSDGYGRFRSHVGGLAHRYSWVIHNREFEDHETYENKYVIMHSCDNPKCVNPNHLSLGTSKLNNEDRDKKGRQVFIPRHGEDNPMSKITTNMARLIYQAKAKQKDISKHFNVGMDAVAGIRSGRTWILATKGLKRGIYELI